jgi:hypothetical protein
MYRTARLLLIALATAIVGVAAPSASASVTIDGSFSTATAQKDFLGLCPSKVADECGTMQLVGLGTADWAYTFGPTFDRDGRCYDVDGSLTITLQSDGSTISGPLTGVFCPLLSDVAHQHVGAIAFGNPFREDDTVALANGTGQFQGLSGTATFHTFDAGARFKGTLNSILSGRCTC